MAVKGHLAQHERAIDLDIDMSGPRQAQGVGMVINADVSIGPDFCPLSSQVLFL